MSLRPDQLAQSLFPPGVAVAGGPVTDWQGPLAPSEGQAVAAAGPRRRAEFVAGRTAARAALARLGWPPAALPRAADGPPLWPQGVTGSISHAGGYCLVAVSTSVAALGLDIEALHPLTADIIAEVCTPAERGLLVTDPDIGLAALRIFSAKEAAYKAQFMLTRCTLGFEDITVALSADGGFVATLQRQAGAFATGTTWAGRQAPVAGLLISALAFR